VPSHGRISEHRISVVLQRGVVAVVRTAELRELWRLKPVGLLTQRCFGHVEHNFELPLDIRNNSTISSVRHQLKTLFYKAAFWPPSPAPQFLAGQWPTLHALQIHLLTYLLK